MDPVAVHQHMLPLVLTSRKTADYFSSGFFNFASSAAFPLDSRASLIYLLLACMASLIADSSSSVASDDCLIMLTKCSIS